LIIEIIINFVESVGIKVFKMPIAGNTFLPGLQLKDGALIVDTEKLLYPGDILHEAGHLATTSPEVRKTMSDDLPPTQENQGGEIMALAWSYAAARHLQIDPHIVFHADGYKGGSESLVENFSEGRYIGLPLLQWVGMAYDEHKAKEFNKPPFPHMIKWLREN
jgi:hypothetical protein